jgi:hypothetical protein
MKSFLVRVVMYENLITEANSTEYKALHDDMKDHHFLREIKGDSGIWYHLPPAEYEIETDDTITIDMIYTLAKMIVDKVDPNNAIFIAEVRSYKWVNLTKVKS